MLHILEKPSPKRKRKQFHSLNDQEKRELKSWFEDFRKWEVDLKLIGKESLSGELPNHRTAMPAQLEKGYSKKLRSLKRKKVDSRADYMRAYRWRLWANGLPGGEEPTLKEMSRLRELHSEMFIRFELTNTMPNLLLALSLDMEQTSRKIHDVLVWKKCSVYQLIDDLNNAFKNMEGRFRPPPITPDDLSLPLGIWGRGKAESIRRTLETIFDYETKPELQGTKEKESDEWWDKQERETLWGIGHYEALAKLLKVSLSDIFVLYPGWDKPLSNELSRVRAMYVDAKKRREANEAYIARLRKLRKERKEEIDRIMAEDKPSCEIDPDLLDAMSLEHALRFTPNFLQMSELIERAIETNMQILERTHLTLSSIAALGEQKRSMQRQFIRKAQLTNQAKRALRLYGAHLGRGLTEKGALRETAKELADLTEKERRALNEFSAMDHMDLKEKIAMRKDLEKANKKIEKALDPIQKIISRSQEKIRQNLSEVALDKVPSDRSNEHVEDETVDDKIKHMMERRY